MRVRCDLVKRLLWSSGICWMLLSVQVFAQTQRTVSGTVKDPQGEGLPGVAVNIENTTTGTITDLDGNFTLNANDGEALIFTMVGMEPTRLEVSATQNWNVVLQESTEVLQEVVVTGFQEVDRKLFTGSSENVRMADI